MVPAPGRQAGERAGGVAAAARSSSRPSSGPIVRLHGVRFGYPDGGFELAIDDLVIERGERVACIGPSGTGKTTLVHLIAGIAVPRAGRVELDGEVVSALGDARRRACRARTIGMVFQQLELLEYLDALDNVLLPYHVSRALRLDGAVRQRAHRLAAAVGIEHVLGRRPARLSQGERQRVALCRALVTAPPLVVGDEPTGSLDPNTARSVLDLLFEQVAAHGATLLMVTHDHGLLGRFDRVLDMRELARP